MRIKSIIAASLALASLTAAAQTNSEPANENVIGWAKNKVDKMTQGKYDPDYVTTPEKKWIVFANVYGGYNKFNLNVPIPYLKPDDVSSDYYPALDKFYTYKIRLHQDTRGASVGLGYGCVKGSYSFNLGKTHDSHFSFEALGSKFGLSLDYRHSKEMKGTMYDALDGSVTYLIYTYNIMEQYDIRPEDLSKYITPQDLNDIMNECTTDIPSTRNDYTTLHIQGHYVFNSRHFSYSAASSPTLIQKRSAGSPLVLLDFYGSRAKFHDSLLLGDDESFTTWKGSVGGGYAYNYTPNQGKLLIHASVIPSVTLISKSKYDTHPVSMDYYARMTYELYHDDRYQGLEHYKETYPEDYKTMCQGYEETKKQTLEQTEQHQKTINATAKVTLNCTARLSATWNVNEHYVLGAYGTYHYSNYANKEHYSFKEHNFGGQVYLAYRF